MAHCLCCLWNSLERGVSVQEEALWWGVCVCVCRHHLSCNKRIETSPVLSTIHLYHEGTLGYS